MSAFLFAMVAVFALSLGGRDQMRVAILADRLGRSWGLLVAGCLTAIATAAIMAFAGAGIAEILPPAGKQMLVAFALIASAFELLLPVRIRVPAEPTRSLGAMTIVLFVAQIADAGRFVVFALAALYPHFELTGAGGALGGCLAILLGWRMAGNLAERPWRAVRIALAVVLAIVGAIIGLSVRGLL